MVVHCYIHVVLFYYQESCCVTYSLRKKTLISKEARFMKIFVKVPVLQLLKEL